MNGGQESPDQARLNRMNARIEHMNERAAADAAAVAQDNEKTATDAAVVAQNIKRVEKVTQDITQIKDEMESKDDIRRAEAA